MADDPFECTVRWRDEVLGMDFERRFAGDSPYDVIWKAFYDRDARLHGRRRLRIEHVPSGTAKTVAVDFDGVDEDDFSAPVVTNERALDEWSSSCGVEIYPDGGQPS